MVSFILHCKRRLAARRRELDLYHARLEHVTVARLLGQVHQTVEAEKLALQPGERILIAEALRDPGNLGTLIRTARSFGFDAVVTSETSCDLYNEKVLRSTQGAVFQIPVVRRNLSDYVSSLQKQGVYVIATTLAEAVPMKEMNVSDKMAVILGNEGNGVSLELQKQADQRVRIEMSGFESLNVAVAGGILMYQLQKQVKI